jgi:purine-binding chemotaxis protein CheW
MTNKPIDWEAIHQHLNTTKQMLEKHEPSIEEINQILHQRANELTKEMVLNDKENFIKILEFKLGLEQYGIESTYVSRVCEAKDIMHLPGTPNFIEGIINIHGNLVCVIDLKCLFGLPKVVQDDLNKILIINYDDVQIGILADSISGVGSVMLETLQKTLPTLSGIHSDFLVGITPDQKIILNSQKLVSHKDLVINDIV